MSFKGLDEWPKERIKLWTKKKLKKNASGFTFGHMGQSTSYQGKKNIAWDG